MKDFADLYAELDATTSTQAKVAALVRYFQRAGPADAAWAAYFLSGGKPRQLIRTAQLRALATEAAGLPDWLFEASYQAVGDLAETIARLQACAAAGADVHDAAAVHELKELHRRDTRGVVVAFEVLDVFARDQVDLLIPLAVERGHGGQLLPLGGRDFRKERNKGLHARAPACPAVVLRQGRL